MRYVEEFKKKFTTLDCNVASRAIFPNEVVIKYEGDDCVELIPKDGEFTYGDINTMINHMLRHGFSFKREVLSSILESAISLSLGNMFVLRDVNSPSYVVGTSQCTVSISPVTLRYLDFQSGPTQELIRILQDEGAVSGVDVDEKNRVIRVSITGNISEALDVIINSFIAVGAVDKQEKRSAFQLLVRQAFDDLTGSELKIVRSIASCPLSHPLSKYKDAARGIERILTGLRDKQLDAHMLRQLEDALEKKGEFSVLPTVLTKGFSKLTKNFGATLHNIMGEASEEDTTETH